MGIDCHLQVKGHEVSEVTKDEFLKKVFSKQ